MAHKARLFFFFSCCVNHKQKVQVRTVCYNFHRETVNTLIDVMAAFWLYAFLQMQHVEFSTEHSATATVYDCKWNQYFRIFYLDSEILGPQKLFFLKHFLTMSDGARQEHTNFCPSYNSFKCIAWEVSCVWVFAHSFSHRFEVGGGDVMIFHPSIMIC